MARTVLNGLAFLTVATLPSAASNTGAVFASAGVLWCSNGVNWIPLGPVTVASALVGSFTFNTVSTYLTQPYKVPANTLAVGSTFRITICGTCTSTVANTVTAVVRIGTAGTTADTAVLSFGWLSAASGSNIPFKIEAIVTIRTLTASGTVQANISVMNSGTTGIAQQTNNVNGNGTTAAYNATVANFIGLSMSASAATTTMTINTATVEQVV